MLFDIIFISLVLVFSFLLLKIFFDYKLLSNKLKDYNQSIKSLFLNISDNEKSIRNIQKSMDQVSKSGIKLIVTLVKSIIPFTFNLILIKKSNPEISSLVLLLISTIPYLFTINNKQ